MALGAFFVLAISLSACGGSSKKVATGANGVPTNAVALVAGNPISKQAYAHWMYVADKGQSLEEQQQGGSVPVIVPSDPPQFTSCIAQIRAQIAEYKTTAAKTLRSDCQELFTSLNSSVMNFLIEAYWYQATAYKEHVNVTKAELTKAFKAAQKTTFPTPAEYTEFLSETGETRADLDYRLRVNTIFQKLINKKLPKVTTAAEMKYYTAHASEFGTPATRNIKLIQTASKANISAAQAALKSGQSFAAVAKKYSTNTATKTTGGVLTDVGENQEEAAVNKVIFAAPLNKLEGPIKGTFGYYLVEVTKITPAVKDAFSKEQKEIKELLTQQNETAAESALNAAEKKQWGAQTKCASAYSINDCAGYVAPKTTTTAAAATPTTADATPTTAATLTQTPATTSAATTTTK
jgi:foldase protein PrsA